MNLIGKLQPVIIITAALLGLLLGALTPLGSVSSGLIDDASVHFVSVYRLKADQKIFYQCPVYLDSSGHQLCVYTPIRLPAWQAILP